MASSDRAGMQQQPPELSRKARGLIARIRRDSNDVAAVRELEEHYADVGDYGSLANLLAGWAEILLDGRRAADALRRGADAILVGIGDRERACTFLEHALTRCPSHEGALHQLSQLLTQAKDHERLRQCMRRIAADLDGDLEHAAYQASVEYKLGRLCEEIFEQPGKAVLRYRRAIELVPTMLPAITAARRLYLEAGDYAAVASLFEFEIRAATADDDKVALLVELARCYQGRLGDHDKGVKALRQALQLQPHNASLMTELAEMLADRRGTADAQSDDGRRSAELFYQAARLVPETEAGSLLEAALEQDPSHAAAASWSAQLGGDAPDAHSEPSPAPAATPFQQDPLAAPLPPRPTNAMPRRSTPPPPPPQASSMLPPPPASAVPMASAPRAPMVPAPIPDDETVRVASVDDSTAATQDVTQDVSRNLSGDVTDDAATRLSPLPPAAVQSQDDDEPTRISSMPPAPAAEPATEVDEPTRVASSPFPEPTPGRGDVDEWLATPASDTVPLDTQGLRPIDGATLSDPPPPPSSRPALRSGASGPSRPVPSTKNLADKVGKLRDRLRRRSSVAPPSPAAPSTAPAAAPAPSVPAATPVVASPTRRVVELQPSPAPAPAVVDAALTPAPVPAPLEAAVAPSGDVYDDAAGESSKLVDALPAQGARVELEVNLGPVTESNFYSGFDGTLANGGVFVATYDTVPVDTEVALTLTLPGGYIAEAHGRVRFVRDVFDFDAHADPGLGVQFEAITRDSLELIERFAQKRTPIFFD